jgi:non-ribosomal peptide synthetase component F
MLLVPLKPKIKAEAEVQNEKTAVDHKKTGGADASAHEPAGPVADEAGDRIGAEDIGSAEADGRADSQTKIDGVRNEEPTREDDPPEFRTEFGLEEFLQAQEKFLIRLRQHVQNGQNATP